MWPICECLVEWFTIDLVVIDIEKQKTYEYCLLHKKTNAICRNVI